LRRGGGDRQKEGPDRVQVRKVSLRDAPVYGLPERPAAEQREHAGAQESLFRRDGQRDLLK
jgi:hypothetical protein